MHQGRFENRGTTLVRRFFTKAAFESASTLLRDDGRFRRSLCGFQQSVRNSKTMFSDAFRTSFPPAEALCNVSQRLLFSSLSFSYSVVIVLSLHGNARFVNCACCTQKLKNSGADLYKTFDSVQNKEKSRAGPHSSAVELKLVEKPVILLDKQIIRWEGAL